jgi:hypothetical protein
VDWLLLAGLVIMWAALLLPLPKRKRTTTYGDLAMFTNRRVIMPEPGQPFLGSGRTRARARERRRRVFTVMLETLGLTFLIGLFPPLRAMWSVSAVVAGLLVIYMWMLIRMKAEREAGRSAAPAAGPIPVSRAATPSIQQPQFPVVEDAHGRRVVVISDPAVRRRAPVAG